MEVIVYVPEGVSDVVLWPRSSEVVDPMELARSAVRTSGDYNVAACIYFHLCLDGRYSWQIVF